MSICFSLEIKAQAKHSRQVQSKKLGGNPTQLQILFQNVLNPNGIPNISVTSGAVVLLVLKKRIKFSCFACQ
jgi:hypothetical protein